MRLSRRALGVLLFLLVLVSLPALAIRKKDTGGSGNGSFLNCDGGSGVCAYLGAHGTVTLTGADQSGNAVTVTIYLYDWGYYPCGNTSCKPVINSAVLDITLTGTDSAGIESLVIKGKLSSPAYVSCAGEDSSEGIACIYAPEPDGQDVQEPTPIAGADTGGHINTRWDFGGIPPENPPLPAIPFDQLDCLGDDGGPDKICDYSPLGEAILTVVNGVTKNKLGTSASDYLVTLTDGTKLGTLAVPSSPTKQVVNTNNTQATATVINKTAFKDYTDASQAYPLINDDGTEQYPDGFTPLPLTNPPPCNQLNDNRTFRTAWYSYTPSSNGSVTLSTAGSRYDTLIYVFTGSASQPTVIACDDDPFPSTELLQAATSFNVTQGTNYQIMVGETPTFVGYGAYPLSVDSILYFNFQFSPNSVKAPTVTTLTSSPNPSTLGQTANFSAAIATNGVGTPTGTVTFDDGSAVLGTSSVSGGTALFSTAGLVAGEHSITATYSGDSTFSGSTSPALSQDVLATTTTILTSSPNPSKPGASVTFTATVTSSAGIPIGSVQFLNGTTVLKTVNLVSGIAEYKTSKLAIGSNIVTAVYSGDYFGSTSNAINQIVDVYSPTILYSFTGGTDGGNPSAGLAQDPQGNLYGATAEGGNPACNNGGGCGTVFKVDTSGHETVLYSFTGVGGDGMGPVARLLLDAQGNLYGTTNEGGDLACGNGYGCGTVFKIDTSGHETVLYTFTGTGGDGAWPSAGLIRDAQSNLYGTTGYGGNLACEAGSGEGCGIVFKVTSAGQETVLYTFTGTGGDGALPYSPLVQDAQGNLYGTTNEGGDPACYGGNGCGTVFKIDTSDHETVLYTFTGADDGAYPSAGMVLDSQGNLYGTTAYGGSNSEGNVFKLDTTGHESVLYSFTGLADGGYPNDLIRDSKGNLYSTTYVGGDITLCYAYGSYGCGTVFKINPSNKETVLYVFTGTEGDGAYPPAGVVRDSQGNLYGTTAYGGANGDGAVFKIAPF